jgi:hypothetical protein
MLFSKFSIIVKIRKKKKLSKSCQKVIKKLSRPLPSYCYMYFGTELWFVWIVKSSLTKAKIVNFVVEDETCGRRRIRKRRRWRRMVSTRPGADYVATGKKKKIWKKNTNLKTTKKITFLHRFSTFIYCFYQVRQGRTWSRNYKSPSPPPPSSSSNHFRIFSLCIHVLHTTFPNYKFYNLFKFTKKYFLVANFLPTL